MNLLFLNILTKIENTQVILQKKLMMDTEQTINSHSLQPGDLMNKIFGTSEVIDVLIFGVVHPWMKRFQLHIVQLIHCTYIDVKYGTVKGKHVG